MIKLTGYFTRFGSRADGSASLAFTTQELSGEEYANLKEHQNQFGHILFKENEFTLNDIPKEEAVEDKGKTPSRRLRAVLYALAKDKKIPDEKFEDFYKRCVERFIQQVKDELD